MGQNAVMDPLIYKGDLHVQLHCHSAEHELLAVHVPDS